MESCDDMELIKQYKIDCHDQKVFVSCKKVNSPTVYNVMGESRNVDKVYD